VSDKYIENGEVARAKIALDIKYRKLKRAEIERLVADPKISSAFFGNRLNVRKARKYWNKAYLEELSAAVIAETFNRDYLLYLDEVAEYVSKPPLKKIIIACIIIVLAIIAGIVVYAHISNNESEYYEGTTESGY